MQITISKENYLKAIAEAESEGETVIAATLARWLEVSAPAVTMAIRRLKRDGLIRVAASGELSLTRDGREIANRVKARTSQKGKALFHPIRVVLTGRAEGPELDLAVPAIDLGAELPASAGIPPVIGNRERAAAFARALEALRPESC